VGGDERLRLFLGLPLPDEPRRRLAEWAGHAFGGADVRIVPPENLHVTLVFLGGRPADEVDAIVGELRAAASGVRPLVLDPERYRETRSVGMVVFADEDGRATALADDLSVRLERLGVYRPEQRPWLPHVTVARFRRPPRLRVDPPALGPVSPSEAALYTSVLRRTGAQYEIRESVPLGG
jgi:RNA 2',3'-cyclic 3'-phosphodiesterase